MNVEVTRVEMGQLVKILSWIFIAIVSLALRESPAKLTLTTVLVHLVIMVAHALTG